MAPSISNDDDKELTKLFDCSRIFGGVEQFFLILLYSPLGVILSLIRVFMLIHIYMISCILPLTIPICRTIIRVMLVLCGLAVRVKDEEHRRDVCPVIVTNYISPVDRIILSLVQPNIMANEWGLPPFLSWLFALKDLNRQNSSEAFLRNARDLCRETRLPMFTRPEGLPTSGKHALLKFSTWQFSISDSVQPVVLEASRPMPISLTTMRSNVLSDIFWFIFTPYTLFTVRYLPVVVKGEGETAEDFSDNVRGRMATALNIGSSKYSRHDSRELMKRLVYKSKQSTYAPFVNSTSTPSVRPNSQPLAPSLEAMVQYCKEVVPQVPLDVLRAEILRTQDSEATLSNIFEGNLQYEPESTPRLPSAEPSRMRAPSVDISKSGGSQTYAAKVFAKASNQREMSLSERKNAMLTEARIRYIEKHCLSITLEQVESGHR